MSDTNQQLTNSKALHSPKTKGQIGAHTPSPFSLEWPERIWVPSEVSQLLVGLWWLEHDRIGRSRNDQHIQQSQSNPSRTEQTNSFTAHISIVHENTQTVTDPSKYAVRESPTGFCILLKRE